MLPTKPLFGYEHERERDREREKVFKKKKQIAEYEDIIETQSDPFDFAVGMNETAMAMIFDGNVCPQPRMGQMRHIELH